MPLSVTQEDGTVIEVPTPEEAKALQDQLAESQARITKLENKDYNFRRLEEMTEAEKEKLTTQEIILQKKAEELDATQKNFTQQMRTDLKNDAFDKYVGDDEDLKKKVEFNLSRFKDFEEAKTRDQIETLVKESVLLSTGGRRTNPLSAAMSTSGSVPFTPSTSSSKVSDDVLEVARMMGISADDFKKYSK